MYLKEGDLVAIVSPSRAISEAEMQSGVNLLEAAGLRVAVGKNAYNVNHQFAGTEQEKLADLQWAVESKEVKAVWASRGGYGAVRLVDELNFLPLKNNFKWFVGYSDFTVFHSHLNRMGLPSIHATMPVNVQDNANEQEAISNQSLVDALTGNDLVYDLSDSWKAGNAEGEMVGGNLSILYSLCGSPSDISTKRKILFLEDLDEYLYHVDRMMMNMKRTGKLDDLAALVVGGMSDMNDNNVPYGKTAEEIIWEHVKDYDYPVYFNFEAGHCQPNRALRFGSLAKIEDNQLILSA